MVGEARNAGSVMMIGLTWTLPTSTTAERGLRLTRKQTEIRLFMHQVGSHQAGCLLSRPPSLCEPFSLATGGSLHNSCRGRELSPKSFSPQTVRQSFFKFLQALITFLFPNPANIIRYYCLNLNGFFWQTEPYPSRVRAVFRS